MSSNDDTLQHSPYVLLQKDTKRLLLQSRSSNCPGLTPGTRFRERREERVEGGGRWQWEGRRRVKVGGE